MTEAEDFLSMLSQELQARYTQEQTLLSQLKSASLSHEHERKRRRTSSLEGCIKMQNDGGTMSKGDPNTLQDVMNLNRTDLCSSPPAKEARTPGEDKVGESTLVPNDACNKIVEELFKNRENAWINTQARKTALDMWNLVETQIPQRLQDDQTHENRSCPF